MGVEGKDLRTWSESMPAAEHHEPTRTRDRDATPSTAVALGDALGEAPSTANLKLVVTTRGNQALVVVHGEVDLATAPSLTTCLQTLAHQGMVTVTVDLHEVSFLDAAGLRTLVAARGQLRWQGGDLAVISPSDRARRVLELTGLDGLVAAAPPPNHARTQARSWPVDPPFTAHQAHDQHPPVGPPGRGAQLHPPAPSAATPATGSGQRERRRQPRFPAPPTASRPQPHPRLADPDPDHDDHRAGTLGQWLTGQATTPAKAGHATQLAQAALQNFQDFVETAVLLVHADHAAVMIYEDQRPGWMAASDAGSLAFARAEATLGEGPSLAAVRQQRMVQTEDLRTDPRWPRLLPAAAEHGVGGMLAAPLVVHGHPTGACSVSTAAPRRWTESETRALRAAARLLGALLHARADAHATATLAEQLQHALDHRVVIEQAKGALIERHGVSAEKAFELLRTTARSSRRTVVDVAAVVLAGRRDQRTPPATNQHPQPPRP
jgi:anti-anti-sigma factor